MKIILINIDNISLDKNDINDYYSLTISVLFWIDTSYYIERAQRIHEELH